MRLGLVARNVLAPKRFNRGKGYPPILLRTMILNGDWFGFVTFLLFFSHYYRYILWRLHDEAQDVKTFLLTRASLNIGLDLFRIHRCGERFIRSVFQFDELSLGTSVELIVDIPGNGAQEIAV